MAENRLPVNQVKRIRLPAIGKVAHLWAPLWIRPWLANHLEVLEVQAEGAFWIWVYLS